MREPLLTIGNKEAKIEEQEYNDQCSALAPDITLNDIQTVLDEVSATFINKLSDEQQTQYLIKMNWSKSLESSKKVVRDKEWDYHTEYNWDWSAKVPGDIASASKQLKDAVSDLLDLDWQHELLRRSSKKEVSKQKVKEKLQTKVAAALKKWWKLLVHWSKRLRKGTLPQPAEAGVHKTQTQKKRLKSFNKVAEDKKDNVEWTIEKHPFLEKLKTELQQEFTETFIDISKPENREKWQNILMSVIEDYPFKKYPNFNRLVKDWKNTLESDKSKHFWNVELNELVNKST